MKNKIKTCVALLSLLIACQQPESVENECSVPAVSVNASIGQSAVSRTSADTDGNTSFAEEDRIGFFMPGEDETSVIWEYSGGKWLVSPTLYWPDKENSFEFCAFYPGVEESVRSQVPMPDLSLQKGNLTQIGEHDFLVAHRSCSYADDKGVVSFTGTSAFKHVYALLLVTIKKEKAEEETKLKVVSFEGQDIATRHCYDFTGNKGSGNVKKVEGTPEVNKLEFGLGTGGTAIPVEGYKMAVLLNASELSEPLDFSIAYTRKGEAYRARTDKMGSSFQSGYVYKYTVQVQDKGLSVTGDEICEWIEGNSLGDIVVNETPEK